MLHWKKKYNVTGFNPAGERPNFSKCAAEVEKFSKGGFTSRQCTKNSGHGPDGAYCKCHAAKFDE